MVEIRVQYMLPMQAFLWKAFGRPLPLLQNNSAFSVEVLLFISSIYIDKNSLRLPARYSGHMAFKGSLILLPGFQDRKAVGRRLHGQLTLLRAKAFAVPQVGPMLVLHRDGYCVARLVVVDGNEDRFVVVLAQVSDFAAVLLGLQKFEGSRAESGMLFAELNERLVEMEQVLVMLGLIPFHAFAAGSCPPSMPISSP